MSKSKSAFLMGITSAICILVSCFASPALAQSTQAHTSQPAGGVASSAAAAAYDESHEDWTSIKAKPDELEAKVPILGEKDDVPGNSFIRERYQMLWRSMDPLDVYVIRPRAVEKPPVILYLYSFPQDTDRFQDDRWCTTVTSNGYAAIGFVSHLTGHRIHDRPVKEWFVSELQESLADSTHDVQMILNYVDTRSDLDSTRVGMFGVGSGGAIAILAAAADPRIKVLNLLSPWGDWPDWLAKSKMIPDDERASYLTPEFLAKVAPLDPIVWLPKLTSVRIRIQNIRGISGLPDECQKKIEAAAPSEAVVDQFESGRAFVPVSMGGKVFDWIKEQLKPVPAPAIAANSPGVHYYSTASTSTLPALPTSN
jgi:pimeloyl-ACP methyl ester carboxylesterase